MFCPLIGSSSRTDAAYPSSVKIAARTSAAPSSGCSARTLSNRCSMNAARRLANSRIASSPPVSARKRSACAARSSYCWSKRSRPPSVSANSFAGRPRPRWAWLRGSRGSTAPSSSSWSRCRRTAAGVRSSRSASAAAVEGPLTRIDRATRSRVGWSCTGTGASSNSTTQVCLYCFDGFKEGNPYLHSATAGGREPGHTRPVPTLTGVPDASPAVAVDGLVMRYGDKVAVDSLSLTVERATITAVLGPNGAGKTTTLETCEGYRRPQQGSVRVLGLDPVKERTALLPRIGVMLQGGGAWSGVRAMEMLEHIARLHAHPLDTDLLAERLGLGDCGRTPYRRLSGGQQQRLGLAMALVGRPEIVFVDEPTAGMDPQARRTTWELLRELREDGVTVVLTTHYMDEAERLADQIHIIDRGRLIASGSPMELTRGGSDTRTATIRLVVTRPFPSGTPDSLRSTLGSETEVTQLDELSLVLSGPADASTLAKISGWCDANGVLPESLSLGQRNLEDVFLELTGRELTP